MNKDCGCEVILQASGSSKIIGARLENKNCRYREIVARGPDKRIKQVIMLPGHTTIRKHARREVDHWRLRFLDMEALANNREKIITELREGK